MNDLDLRSTHPPHPGRAQPDPVGLRSAAAALRLRHAPGHSQARETEPHQQRRARLGDHRPANALDPELENLRLEEVVRVVPEPEYEGSRLEMGHVGEAEASRQSRRIRETRQLEGQQEGRSGERCEGEVRPVQRAICPYNPGLDLEIARAVWIQMDVPGSPGRRRAGEDRALDLDPQRRRRRRRRARQRDPGAQQGREREGREAGANGAPGGVRGIATRLTAPRLT